MTTEFIESDRWPSTDTDLSAPAPSDVERAKSEVVRVWSDDRKSSTWPVFGRRHLAGDESYDINLESWCHFDRLLDAHIVFSHLRMTFPSDVAEQLIPYRSHFTYSGESIEKIDRRRRYAELSKLLDQWANDPSDFDDRVAPLIEEALRETSPRHFPDE